MTPTDLATSLQARYRDAPRLTLPPSYPPPSPPIPAGALGWRLPEEEVLMLDSAADALEWEFNGCGFQTADSKFVGYGFEKWKLD